jgi:mannitol/fructose-specific phosphotransferase system IIA component (Ntr-type)
MFLMLIPPRAHDLEVRILAQIARAMIDPDCRKRLLEAKSVNEAIALVSEHRPKTTAVRPPRASLADI